MNVACSSCPAKYAVPDEKVRGRKVRITCKRCGAAIIVDGTALAAEASDGAPAPSPTSAPAPAAAARPAPATGDAPGAPPPAAEPAAAKAESDAPARVGAAPPEGGTGDAAVATGGGAQAKPATDAAATDARKPIVGAKPSAATAKPLASVPKTGEAKAGAFPKPGISAKGPALGTPLGGAAAKAATPVAGAVAGKGATPGKAATLGTAASAKATPLTGSAGANAVTGTAARGAVASAQAARAVVPRVGGATAPAVAPSALPDRTWTVAVTDDDHHEMTLAQIVEAYAAEKIDAETFIWRDGMQDWLMPFEIGEIATALRARRLVPRTNAAATGGAAPVGEDPPPGAWREPGRWDRNDAAPEEPSFDDVTVAMEAPKAKALLQAVSSEEAAAKAESPKPATAKNDEPTIIAPKPDEATIHAPVTPASLGFGDDEAPKVAPVPTESITAIAESLEREPERLPFELAPSAAAPRAALRSGTNETEKPRDLFARGASEGDAPAVDAEGDDGDAAAKALTGARNESSVLFSLDQLAKPAAKAAAPSALKKKDAAELLLGDAPAAPVAGIAGGGLFGSATKMAAPDFTAPPAPSEPPPAAKGTSGAPAAEKGSRGPGVWIGALVVLAALGGGVYFLSRPPAPQPSPEPTATATPAATTPAPVASPTEPAATASAAPAATTSASAAPAESAAPAASAGAPAAPAASASAAATAAPGTSATAPAATAPSAPAQPKPTQSTPAAPKVSATAEPAAATGPDFDKDAAMATLATAAANSESQCASEEGTHGTGKVTVTFANSGRATNALVSGDFAGSALGGCVARIFRAAKVPAFGGDPVRVSKTVRIP